MEFFPDGAHVRLRSIQRDMFLFADKDGLRVSLSKLRESLNTAWLVHRVVRHGVPYLLLHSAAYGRYLSASEEPAGFGHHGERAEQRPYSFPFEEDVCWLAERSGDHIVRLRHHHTDRLLRANGMYVTWHNRVSVDLYHQQSTMANWHVDYIPPRPAPPVLPFRIHIPVRGRVLVRDIVYKPADNLESFDPDDTITFRFAGRSVFQLRHEMATLLEIDDDLDITLCVRSGHDGARWVPLVTDLPRDETTLFIIVLPAESPAALAFRHPDVYAPSLQEPGAEPGAED